MLKRLTSLLRRSTPIQTSEFPLEFAFECGGKKYYQFTDKNNMPALRGLEAMTFYHEMQNGVTNKYLKSHMARMNEVLSNSKSVNLGEVYKLHYWLDERLKYAISKDIIYNVASVAFVEEGENPATYDHAFNKKKIQNWKENGANGFFLLQPLRTLIPFLQTYGEGSLMYLEVVDKIEAAISDIAQLKAYAEELKTEND